MGFLYQNSLHPLRTLALDIGNTAVKAGMVAALGGQALRWPVLLATGAIVVAGVGVAALQLLRQPA
jgi:hypothetical protein